MLETCKWTRMLDFWYPGCESFGIPDRPLDGATCPYCGKPIGDRGGMMPETQKGQTPSLDTTAFLCDLLDAGHMKVVFWTCPNECRGGVTWDHSGPQSVATCDTCGRRSADAC
jgi:hypothetical protein